MTYIMCPNYYHNYHTKIIPEYSKEVENCMESLFFKIKLNDKICTNVGCIYRAPNTDIPDFIDELEVILNFTKNQKMYICGDFNIDLLKCGNHQNSDDFVNKLFSYGFFPLINTPTRVTGSTATLIDNIYTNEMSVNIEPGILINDISDHLPILCMVDYIFPKKNNTKKSTFSKICTETK